jgi:glycosyltransferase involved in cell wall biosynthesis
VLSRDGDKQVSGGRNLFVICLEPDFAKVRDTLCCMKDSDKKVLVVTTVPITLTSFLLPLTRALRAQGWQVDALSAGASAWPGLEGEFDALFDVEWSRKLSSFRHYPRIAHRLRRLVAARGYDVVHVHTPIASFMTRFALRKTTGLRMIHTAHGFHFYRAQDASEARRGRLFRRAEQLCLHWTDDLIVMNDEDEISARELLASIAGVDGRTRATLHRIDGIGIELSDWTPQPLSADREAQLRQEYQLPPEAFTVVTIAELNDNKRHNMLLDAIALLTATSPHLRFLFVGTGPLDQQLHNRVDAENLPVSFTGQISHELLRELLKLCNLGLLVSEREGLPRSLMEICAAGVPIAGTRTRGIIDEVLDERALAHEATAEAVADLVESLSIDKELRAELARTQLEYASAHFTLETIIPQYLALYEAAGATPLALQR